MSLFNEMHSVCATCSRGLESLLADELMALGCEDARPAVGRVKALADHATLYRVLIETRLANRWLLLLSEARVETADELSAWLTQLDWSEHLSAQGSLLVDVNGTARGLRHTHDTALRVKDAVVDFFRAHGGLRPRVDRERPDIRLHLRLEKGRASLYLDLGGGSLHQRGYRLAVGQAPLKENLAAALLLRAGWPVLAAQGAALLDPFCGSGTLLAEAALMAKQLAPGLLRTEHPVARWLGHRPALLQQALDEAVARREACKDLPVKIFGSDRDPQVIEQAKANLARAGLDSLIELQIRPFAQLPPAPVEAGLVITNPPYGERLDEIETLMPLYASLGETLLDKYPGWRLALLTSEEALARQILLAPYKKYPLKNASLDCQLYLFDLPQDGQATRQGRVLPVDEATKSAPPLVVSEATQMFANRVKKNLRHLSRWVKREGIEAWRVYDADLPDFALAIDCYLDQVHVQEYAPPAKVDPQKAAQRLQEAMQVLPEILGVPPEQLHLKQRKRQTGRQQYEKLAQQQAFFAVREGAAKVWVNLTDYLDSGLFLDHRPVRRQIYQQAQGKRFLNLFCYTGVASIQAALGGAVRTTSVDMSHTYLDWFKRNLTLNQLDLTRHAAVQANCLEWLQQDRGVYDLIFMDPPSFSNSKRMQGVLDVQRDHEQLIEWAMRRLSSEGLLIFSTNLRRFKLSEQVAQRWEVKNITAQSFDPDFERNQRIHQCFEIRKPFHD